MPCRATIFGPARHGDTGISRGTRALSLKTAGRDRAGPATESPTDVRIQ